MPQRKLSAVALPHLGEGEWWDTILPGLVLRVGKKRRSWAVRYHANGRYPRQPLGHYPAMELRQARDAARRILDRAERGLPPEAPAPHLRSTEILTLGDLLDRYESLRRREGRRIKTLAGAMQLLRKNLAPSLALPAAQFSKAELRAARDAMVARDAMLAGNRLLQRLGPVLKWAAQEDLIPANFVPDIRKAPEQRRTRALDDAEIRAIWAACAAAGGRGGVAANFGRLVRFLLVTAQRLDEAASLRHGHVRDGVWRQTDNKSSRPHSLPLPPLALELLGRGDANELVFAGAVGKISGFSKLKLALDEASGVTGWRLHDLRRTAATRMQALSVPPHVIGGVLNHAIPGVGGIYLQDDLAAQKAAALAAWDTALAGIVEP